MSTLDRSRPGGYEAFYRDFDSSLMQRLRREAYGEDIGQHSWVGADEVLRDSSGRSRSCCHRADGF